MTEVYYKVTRVNGRDFYRDFDYGAALISGEVIRDPVEVNFGHDSRTYLSVSVAAADCSGWWWPCRLFRVEPVGPTRKGLSARPNERAVPALRVIEELPAHLAFGPNGKQVVTFIERLDRMTEADWRKLVVAWNTTASSSSRDAVWYATWNVASWNAIRKVTGKASRIAAQGAAWGAAQDAVWNASRDAFWNAPRDAARGAAQNVATDAATAMITRDLITTAHYNALTQPFVDAGFAAIVDR